MTMIGSQLQGIKARIDAACEAAGRHTGAVRLLAVSKTFGADAVREAAATGQRAFGENYVQEALGKMDALADLPLEWHLIGPLQSNKTRVVAERFDWVHSIDRLKVAERLGTQRPAHLPPLQVCIQVNIDGGVHKSGVAPAEAAALARAVAGQPRLVLRGLMAIPEPAPDFEAQKRVFALTASLFGSVKADLGPSGASWDTLSLGMTADLEAAIHAGSTMVRVGTAIFGRRLP